VRNRIVAGMLRGVWQGSVRRVGQCDSTCELRPEPAHQAGAKLVASAEDIIEELPTRICAALVQAEKPEAELRNLLAAASPNGTEKKIYELLNAEEPMPIDNIMERSALNSSEVLATLFDLEMPGIIRQLPRKQFSKVFL
jgi:DNA processing protein